MSGEAAPELARIGNSDKRVAMAAVHRLAELAEDERGSAMLELGDSGLARHINELMDVARPRELKEALSGDDTLHARVAIAEVIRRGEKGEALLYAARSHRDPVVAGAALAALRGMFRAGSLRPRARIDRFWLWRAKIFR